MLNLARREPATHGKAASNRIIALSEGGPQDYLPASSSVGRRCCHLGAALRCFLGDSRMLPSTWLHSCSMGVEHCVSTQELSDCSLSAAELTRSPAEQPNHVDEYQICACKLKQASVLDMLTLGVILCAIPVDALLICRKELLQGWSLWHTWFGGA